MAIKLVNISKKFNQQIVHANLNLEIANGSYHAIQGASGGGKTILLKIIAGLIQQDRGEIYIDGECMNNIPVQERGIGFIFQDYALFPHMTAFDNIAFGLRAQRQKKSLIKSRVHTYAELVGIEQHLHKHPAMLSGGQKQRIAIARALVLEPRILLLDEPLSSLDNDLQTRMCYELKNIHQKLGITMVQVTHNLIEAEFLADHIHILKNGEMITVRPKPVGLQAEPILAELVHAPNLVWE